MPGDAGQAQVSGKGGGQAHHEGGGAVDDDGVPQGLVNALVVQLLIHEAAHDVGIDHADDSGLGGGELAGVDAAPG